MNLTAGLAAACAALLAGLGVQTWRVDQLKAEEVTWKLAAKDYDHAISDLHLAIKIRDGKVEARAVSEASDRSDADSICVGEISSSFQKGVAVGRAITHAQTPSASGQRPAAGGVQRDYRQAWQAGAYRPGS
jgi:hypothetical protein